MLEMKTCVMLIQDKYGEVLLIFSLCISRVLIVF